jgi:hypothetical protein
MTVNQWFRNCAPSPAPVVLSFLAILPVIAEGVRNIFRGIKNRGRLRSSPSFASGIRGALFEKTAPCSIWTRAASAKAFDYESIFIFLKHM